MTTKQTFKSLPHKTIERLSQYRRALLLCLNNGQSHIFSHEIAKIQHITSVQVRRDLMLIGYSGTLRKGYNIQENNDPVAGQIIPHIHWHLIPRHKSDGLKLWPQGKYAESEGNKIMGKIKENISDD